jgi:hypothetical protein
MDIAARWFGHAGDEGGDSGGNGAATGGPRR